MTVKEKIVYAECKKEIPVGCMAISYEDKLFDSYQCLAAFSGVILDSHHFGQVRIENNLKIIIIKTPSRLVSLHAISQSRSFISMRRTISSQKGDTQRSSLKGNGIN